MGLTAQIQTQTAHGLADKNIIEFFDVLGQTQINGPLCICKGNRLNSRTLQM